MQYDPYGEVISSTLALTHTHTYTASGIHTVSLTASGPGGSDTLTRTNYITVSSGLVYTTTHRVISYTYLHNFEQRIDPIGEGWYTCDACCVFWNEVPGPVTRRSRK